MENKPNTIQVEIWSDIMCPFCYIGKRKFEAALAVFPFQSTVEIIWKSFQLSPDLVSNPNKNIHQFLSKHKNVSIQEAKKMNEFVTQMAAKVGLVYNFDISVVSNSFDAHRLSHLAKHEKLQNELEEKLFAAYFTEGKNIADQTVLFQIGKSVGLDPAKMDELFSTGLYADDVRADIEEAKQLGARGVPHFIFNRKIVVSGAQETAVFSKALDRTYASLEVAL
jgi:predicted DsbA family dithiol-disulfide isomerase